VSGVVKRLTSWFAKKGEPLEKEERFSLRTQVTMITFATLTSVAYAAISSGWWFAAWSNPASTNPDGWYYTPVYILAMLLLLVWGPEILWSQSVSEFIRNSPIAATHIIRRPDKPKPHNRWWTHIARYFAGGAMITQLGLLTMPDGGALRSPYSQLLIMCAVLVPVISNTWQTAAVMCAGGTAAYAGFGFGPLAADEVTRNDVLSCFTTGAAAAISVVAFYAPLAFNWLRKKAANRANRAE
jgi:MFS family permease